MTMNLKASYVSHLSQKYPNLSSTQLEGLVSDNLLSPFQVPLSIQQIELIRSEIKKYWKLRQWGVSQLGSQFEKMDLRKPSNFSACMSYDFHINADQGVDLIEINTNAAFLAMGLELYQTLKLPEVASNFNENSLVEMFQAENKLAGNKDLSVAIIDEKPAEQRLFVEFLIYQEMFKTFGVPCQIADVSELEKIKAASLIYNRHTDFYLESSNSVEIKSRYNQGLTQLSPNPYEYFLLADKERFIDWTAQIEIEKPTSLLPTYDLGKSDPNEIWNQRKQLFFKPKNAFGGKQTYKGASISRKVFDEIFNSNFIAQKLSPAPELEVEFKGVPTKMKYDLRCYAYQDELQMIIARLYQGQITNLRTEGGGFACIVIK